MGHCSDCHKFTSLNLIFSDSGILSLPVELIKKNNDPERDFFGGWGGGCLCFPSLLMHAHAFFFLRRKSRLYVCCLLVLSLVGWDTDRPCGQQRPTLLEKRPQGLFYPDKI